MANEKQQDAESTEPEKPEETKYLAVSDHHGWRRDDSLHQAVLGALDNSSYMESGDTVKVTVHEVDPDAQMNNAGYIGVWRSAEESDHEEEIFVGCYCEFELQEIFEYKPTGERMNYNALQFVQKDTVYDEDQV